MGFNPANPLDNYFYAEINKLTLESIAKAFDFKVSVPKIVANTGFPDGLVVGFNTNPAGRCNSVYCSYLFCQIFLFFIYVKFS